MAGPVEPSNAEAVMAVYARAPIRVARGEGAWLEDEDGTRYLDFTAGIAVNALGHAHPHLVEALKAQAERLWHVSNLFAIPDQERLAARLCAATFADRVFFTNSGLEAVEGCIKAARKHHSHNGRPERWRILAFEGAFHGRSLATIAAAGAEKLTKGFGPMPDGFDHAPFGDHEALKAAITPETAAILIEPVQGEGGVRPAPPQCLRGLRELCDQEGLLLIFDEIQTGVGRTGRLFAHEWADAQPDLMAIAKGIGGGFPLGAFLATESACDGMTAGTHGTTFGGNPLAMAVGNAVLDVVLEDGFLDQVSRRAGYLRQKIEGLVAEHPDVFEGARGEGLLIGLKCRAANTDVVAAARAAKLLVVPAGDNVVRLLPPLTVAEAEIDAAVDRLEEAARGLAAA